eukprot:gene28800-37150_t
MTDADVEAQIFALLAQRKPHTTICPSEVARALAGGAGFGTSATPARHARRGAGGCHGARRPDSPRPADG